MSIPEKPHSKGDTFTNPETGVEYTYDGVKWLASGGDELDLSGYVRKEGGDSMQGPLDIRPQDGANGRETSKIQTHRVILNTEGVEDDEAVTKKYIDDVARHLQDEIVELEEEIDAIAPSVERGKWSFTAVGTVAQPGQFTMYDADFGNGSPTGLFKSAKSIWFNELDLDGTPHSFANVKDGELLEIFIDGSPEYGLFSVVGEAHDETATGSKFWVIDVDFVRTNESTTAVGPGEICRFKIFEAPAGGEATSFVMKSGDTMTGNLDIDRSAESTDTEAGLKLKGNRLNATNASATITFENKQSTDKGYLTYRSYDGNTYFKFNRDLDLNNNDLNSVGQIRMEPDGGIGSGNNTRLTFHNASTGQDGEGLLVVPRPSNDRRGFSIRGNDVDGLEQDMLYTYTNPTGTPDAANYVGKIDSPKNLVNKGYVDSKAQSSSRSPVMLHSGSGYAYKFVDKDLSISEFSSDTHQASSSYLYLSRLWGQKRGWTQVVNYDRTEDTIIEVWEATSDTPLLVLRAGVNLIEQSEWTHHDAKLTLNRFWSKPGYSFSKFKDYTFMIHGLVERAELISPLSYGRDDEVIMQPIVQEDDEVS